MALLTNRQIKIAGTADSQSAAATPFTADLSGSNSGVKEFLQVVNGGSGSCTVTVVTPGTDADGNAIADLAVVVANDSKPVKIGPLNQAIYGVLATVTISGSLTSVTADLYQI